MSDNYSEILEGVKYRYGIKALILLSKIRDYLTANGYAVLSPYAMCDDTYQWSMTVLRVPEPEHDRDKIDITVEIPEERDYEDPEGYGINFGMEITEHGGKFLGRFEPYNFTPECWVDARNLEAVAERWQLLENPELESILERIE